jgi:hypothetical protein
MAINCLGGGKDFVALGSNPRETVTGVVKVLTLVGYLLVKA